MSRHRADKYFAGITSYGFGPMSILVVHVTNSGFVQARATESLSWSQAEAQSEHTHRALSHSTTIHIREPPEPWSHQSNTGHSVSSRVLLLRRGASASAQ